MSKPMLLPQLHYRLAGDKRWNAERPQETGKIQTP